MAVVGDAGRAYKLRRVLAGIGGPPSPTEPSPHRTAKMISALRRHPCRADRIRFLRVSADLDSSSAMGTSPHAWSNHSRGDPPVA